VRGEDEEAAHLFGFAHFLATFSFSLQFSHTKGTLQSTFLCSILFRKFLALLFSLLPQDGFTSPVPSLLAPQTVGF
jgi:hypothetical protein